MEVNLGETIFQAYPPFPTIITRHIYEEALQCQQRTHGQRSPANDIKKFK